MRYGTLATWWSFGCHLARLAAEAATDLEETYFAAERSGDESLAGGFGQRCRSRVKRCKESLYAQCMTSACRCVCVCDAFSSYHCLCPFCAITGVTDAMIQSLFSALGTSRGTVEIDTFLQWLFQDQLA